MTNDIAPFELHNLFEAEIKKFYILTKEVGEVLNKKSLKNILKYILGSLAMLVILGIITYVIVLPSINAKAYIARLDLAASKLSREFEKLAESTENPVFNNPDLDSAKSVQEITAIKVLIEHTKNELSTFDKTADELAQIQHLGPAFGSYENAKAMRESALNTISQSNDTLNDYKILVNYIEKYEKLSAKLNERLNFFNTIVDVNILAGKQLEVSQVATEIRSYAAELNQAPAPLDLDDFNKEALTTFNQAAKGFDDLAYGLQIAVDSIIYSAANDIEAATEKNDTKSRDLLVSAADRSPILKNVDELPDKLEQFKVTKP